MRGIYVVLPSSSSSDRYQCIAPRHSALAPEIFPTANVAQGVAIQVRLIEIRRDRAVVHVIIDRVAIRIQRAPVGGQVHAVRSDGRAITQISAVRDPIVVNVRVCNRPGRGRRVLVMMLGDCIVSSNHWAWLVSTAPLERAQVRFTIKNVVLVCLQFAHSHIRRNILPVNRT